MVFVILNYFVLLVAQGARVANNGHRILLFSIHTNIFRSFLIYIYICIDMYIFYIYTYIF